MSARRPSRRLTVSARSRPFRPCLEALEDRLAPAHNLTIATGGTTLLSNPGVSSFSDTNDYTIDPAQFNAATGNGTLQANNDITFQSSLVVASGFSFTALAGRTMNVFAGIRTTNAPLTLKANDAMADGVNESNRDAGSPLLWLNSVFYGSFSVTSGGGALNLIGDSGSATNPFAPLAFNGTASILSAGGPMTLMGHGNDNTSLLTGINLGSAFLDAGGGNIIVSGTGGTGFEYDYGISTAGAHVLTNGSGTIT